MPSPQKTIGNLLTVGQQTRWEVRADNGRAPGGAGSTYASNQLAAEIDPFELIKIMGTSMRMLEKHYGTLLHGAIASIAARQAAFEAAQERVTNDDAEDV